MDKSLHHFDHYLLVFAGELNVGVGFRPVLVPVLGAPETHGKRAQRPHEAHSDLHAFEEFACPAPSGETRGDELGNLSKVQ